MKGYLMITFGCMCIVTIIFAPLGLVLICKGIEELD